MGGIHHFQEIADESNDIVTPTVGPETIGGLAKNRLRQRCQTFHNEQCQDLAGDIQQTYSAPIVT